LIEQPDQAAMMYLYNIVAKLRLFRGRDLGGGADDLDVQVPDLLAQGVAIDTE
jgi:hypothetical protein